MPLTQADENGRPGELVGGGLRGTFENMPTVKVPVFVFSNDHQVLSAIIQGVVVDMMDFACGRAANNQTVHSHCVPVTVSPDMSADIEIVCRPESEPAEHG